MLGNIQTVKRPPRRDRMLRLATTGAAQQLDTQGTVIPGQSLGIGGAGVITIRAITQDVQLYFDSVNTGTIALDSVAANTMGASVPAGQELQLEITGGDRYLNFISRATGGFIEIWRSGQERIDQR